MSEIIPQSVTKRVVLKAYLSSDHVTAATGKTIAVVISKNGAAFGNPSGGATNATAIANGWYYVDLSTTDSGTKGPLIVRGTEGTIDDTEQVFTVASAHNAGFDGVPDAAANTDGGLPILSVSGTTLGYTISTLTTYTGNTVQTGDSYARIGATGSSLTSLAPSSTALSTAQWTNTLATNLGTLAGHDPGATLASRTNITAGTIGTVTNPVTAGTVTDKTGYALSSAGFDSVVLETGVNARQGLALCFSACCGTCSGGGTATMIYNAGNNAGTPRITATVDANGNRSAITLSIPA